MSCSDECIGSVDVEELRRVKRQRLEMYLCQAVGLEFELENDRLRRSISVVRHDDHVMPLIFTRSVSVEEEEVLLVSRKKMILNVPGVFSKYQKARSRRIPSTSFSALSEDQLFASSIPLESMKTKDVCKVDNIVFEIQDDVSLDLDWSDL